MSTSLDVWHDESGCLRMHRGGLSLGLTCSSMTVVNSEAHLALLQVSPAISVRPDTVPCNSEDCRENAIQKDCGHGQPAV